jgi:hypothetical protein
MNLFECETREQLYAELSIRRSGFFYSYTLKV